LFARITLPTWMFVLPTILKMAPPPHVFTSLDYFDVVLTSEAAKQRTEIGWSPFEGLEGARSTPTSEPVIRRN
jgi:hypothetical protein